MQRSSAKTTTVCLSLSRKYTKRLLFRASLSYLMTIFMEATTKSQYFSEEPWEIRSGAPRATIVRRMLKNWPKSIYPIHHPQLPGAASTNHIYKFLRAARRSAAIRKYWTRPKFTTRPVKLRRSNFPGKRFRRVRKSARGGEEGITGARGRTRRAEWERDRYIDRTFWKNRERRGKGED